MIKNLTELEAKMIDNIGGNNFGSGPGYEIWSDSLADGPHGYFVPESSFGGIVSSLVKKGLAGASRNAGRDATVWLTDDGVAIYNEQNS